jgi:hypothetical protein
MGIKPTGFKAAQGRIGRTADVFRPRTITLSLAGKSLEKIHSLGGRDVLRLTPEVTKKLCKVFAQYLAQVHKRGRPGVVPWQAMGEAWKKVLIARIANQGGDLKGTFKPLSAFTVAQKGNGRLFIDSGQLLAELRASTVKVQD